MASGLRAVDISVSALAVVIVVLRLWARSKSPAGFGWDDLLIILAMLVLTTISKTIESRQLTRTTGGDVR